MGYRLLRADYLGGFVVTAGAPFEQLANEHEAKGDDYKSILTKAIADRLLRLVPSIFMGKSGDTLGLRAWQASSRTRS